MKDLSREEAELKYSKGYHKVSYDDWLSLGEIFSPVMSPGGASAFLKVTRRGVLDMAERGKLRYFVATSPWSKRGYVHIPLKDIEELMEERNKKASQRAVVGI